MSMENEFTRYFDVRDTVTAVECLRGGFPLGFLKQNETVWRDPDGAFVIGIIASLDPIDHDHALMHIGQRVKVKPGQMLVRRPSGILADYDQDEFENQYREAPGPELPF